MTATTPISFEFFPPNTPVGSEKLKNVVAELAAVKPEFFSVTYGAGGSTRDKTLATVKDIAALGHEARQHAHVLVVDVVDPLRAELADLAAAEHPAALAVLLVAGGLGATSAALAARSCLLRKCHDLYLR